MEWDNEIDLSRRKMSSQLIVRRALEKGWRVCGFKTNYAIFLMYPPGQTKPIKIFSASPPQMSYTASKISKDKYITNEILKSEGIPVPEEILVEKDYNRDELAQFIDKYKKVVVKPLDASHGKGITMNITTLDGLVEALEEVKRNTIKVQAVVQEELEGIDVRALCINYKYVSAISRVPASVVGDGQHNIRELIEITNQGEDRGNNYKSKLNVIPITQVIRYLGEEALSQVPDAGVDFQVIGVSNVGMGGVRMNIGDLLPEPLQKLAIQVAEIIGLPVCGVDFMVNRLPQPGDTPESLNAKVIEVNECPMLTVYEDIESEEEMKVIDTYLDYISLDN